MPVSTPWSRAFPTFSFVKVCGSYWIRSVTSFRKAVVSHVSAGVSETSTPTSKARDSSGLRFGLPENG